MRVAVMTAGSRGDVAPYTGLGHGLADAGHEVTLVTHARFAPLAAEAGLGFHALPIDPRAELASERGRGLHRSSGGVAKLTRLALMVRGLVGSVTEDLLAAARRSDVLLLSSSLAPLGHVIAEGLSLPSMGVYLQPLAPTGQFPPSVTGVRSYGALGNRLAGHAVAAGVEHMFAGAARALRARLGLPRRAAGAAMRAREQVRWPILHGFSPLVVPRPPDWRPGLDIAGYWWPHDPPLAELPSSLREFLTEGPPPVFVGLGSATVPDPAGFTDAVVRALRVAGLRGVLQRGWSGLGFDDERALGADMLTVGEVPHSLVFPHTAAVVHHAGAGTTGAVLRAGVPAVPVPVQFDAAFWAARQQALGVSPGAVPLRGFTERALTAALRRATGEPAFARNARDVARRIGAEDGVAPVVAALGRLAGAGGS